MDDPDPLEGQRTDGGVVALAALLLLLVVGPRPGRVRDGVLGVLVEGLAQELRAVPAPVRPAALAAALDDGRDPGIGLHVLRGGMPGAVGSKRAQQARREGGSCTRQAFEQKRVGVRLEQRGDLPVVLRDGPVQEPQLLGQHLDRQRLDGEHRRVLRQRLRRREGGENAFDVSGAAAVVGVVERADGLRPGALDGVQRGPFQQPAAGHGRAEVRTQPGQRLRKVQFQRGLHAQDELGAQVHGLAPLLVQEPQRPRLLVVGHPDGELVAVHAQNLREQPRVAGIVLGPAGRERLAVARQRHRVDRIQVQERVAHQGVHQRAPALLQTDRQPLSRIAGLQLGQPVGQGFGSVLNHPVAAFARGRVPDADIVLLRRPVQPDQRRVFFRFIRFLLVHPVLLSYGLPLGTREPATCESLIVEASRRPTSGVFVLAAGASSRLENLRVSISLEGRKVRSRATRVSAFISFLEPAASQSKTAADRQSYEQAGAGSFAGLSSPPVHNSGVPIRAEERGRTPRRTPPIFTPRATPEAEASGRQRASSTRSPAVDAEGVTAGRGMASPRRRPRHAASAAGPWPKRGRPAPSEAKRSEGQRSGAAAPRVRGEAAQRGAA